MATAEKILLLSLRILKTASNPAREPDKKGLRIHQLSNERTALMKNIITSENTTAIADNARIHLARYIGKIAETKIRAQV